MLILVRLNQFYNFNCTATCLRTGKPQALLPAVFPVQEIAASRDETYKNADGTSHAPTKRLTDYARGLENVKKYFLRAWNHDANISDMLFSIFK